MEKKLYVIRIQLNEFVDGVWYDTLDEADILETSSLDQVDKMYDNIVLIATWDIVQAEETARLKRLIANLQEGKGV